MCETSSHVFVVINIIPEGGAHGSFLFLHHYMDATLSGRESPPFFLHRAKQVVPIAKKSVPDKKNDHLFSSWREKGGY